MTWIEIIDQDTAEGPLRNIYDRVRGPDGAIDNILLAHSQRPHTLEGHMALYKNVLHHSGNTLEKWLAETIGVHVSLINGCKYCVEHHAAGLRRAAGSEERSTAILEALDNGEFGSVFDEREIAALDYAKKLTNRPDSVAREDVDRLRDLGWRDGEILEINQVAAYFAYANRTVLGLGVDPEGETLGRSPSDRDRPDDWQHR